MSEENLKIVRRNFSESTSCHGIGQMYASKSKCQRGFWCFLVLAVSAILTSQVTIRIQAYLARKTTSSITEKYNTTLEMPAITICNFNSFFNITTTAERNAITELAKAKFDTSDEIHYEDVTYFNEVFNGSIRKYATDKGWDISKSLNWCRFRNQECYHENFTYTIGNMGKCWTYNAPSSIEKAGSKHGIYMVFDVQQDRYSESYDYGRWEAGIKVQIHPPTNIPEVDELGLAVPVGSMAFITIKRIEENLMYEPWGQCQPDNEKLASAKTYSHANCFYECYKAALADECECRLYYFKEPNNLSECLPDETLDCLQFSAELLKPFLTPERCGCQPPCNNVRYETKISYGTFPNLAIQDSATKHWGNVTSKYMKDNLVGIHVYYEALTYVTRQEDKQMTWSALLSDLGGQLGLWIGISVVTLFEFGQFVAFHFRALLARCSLRQNRNSKLKTTEPSPGVQSTAL